MTNLLNRIFNTRADARVVAVARILIGINAAFAAFETWRVLNRLLNPGFIKLPYFEWLPVLPRHLLPALILIWVVAAVAFTIGWKTRVAGLALVCAIGYTLLLDQQTYSNHLYLLLLVVLLLTIARSGTTLSVDAGKRAEEMTIPGWPVRLLKIQVTLVYLFSALAKLTEEYLSGQVLLQSFNYSGSLGSFLPRTTEATSMLAIAAILVEVFIGLGLWSKRLRIAAVVAGVVFHAFILTAINSSRLSLGIFALSMFAGYVVFFNSNLVSSTKK